MCSLSGYPRSLPSLLLATTASAVIGTELTKVCIPSIMACSTILRTSYAKGGGLHDHLIVDHSYQFGIQLLQTLL